MTRTVAGLMDGRGHTAEVARELQRRRADLVDHERGSLAQHLVGVYAILERWGQPERVLLAGLLHSGYSTEAFQYRLFGPRERGRVRELVGAEAERLVHAFCACRLEELVAAAVALVANGGEAVEVATRAEGARPRLSRRDLADVLILHAANVAEQTCAARGGPAPWLQRVSGMLAAARACAVDHASDPPVLEGGARAVGAEEEAALLEAYRAMWPRGAAAAPGAEGDAPVVGEVAAVVTRSPVGEPLIAAGMRALAARRGEEAAALGERGLAALEAWGVAWDKRLALPRWRALAEGVVRDGRSRDRELASAAGRMERALDQARGSPERVWAHLDSLGALAPREAVAAPENVAEIGPPGVTEEALPPRFARFIGGLRTNADRPILQFYPGLRTTPWHDPRAFPIVADLERMAPQIAEEARGFDADTFQDEAEDIGRVGRWSVLFLQELGRRNEENLARCPVTASVIARHRTVTTRGGLIYFSCLDPHTRVAPHQGPTNMRLRCHLGLEVPERCGLRVGGVVGRWEEGRCVVFDDSFSHEAWNNSDERRVVLIVDVWHPDLGDDEVALLSGLQLYGAANGTSTRRDWERNDAEREKARRVRK